MGVSGSIQIAHLIRSRWVSIVALGSGGSTAELQNGGGGPPYSSVRRPKLCPSSCKMISTAAEFTEATAMAPPDPPYSVSLTITKTTSRLSGETLVVSTVLTLDVSTQISR